MTKVSVQSHRDGKELAPEVMISNHPAVTVLSNVLNGHDTHVAAIAAGSPVAGASYYGIAGGTAKGGSPGSRIAAFDDAIAKGVNIVNLSFGQPAGTEFELSKKFYCHRSLPCCTEGHFHCCLWWKRWAFTGICCQCCSLDFHSCCNNY
ncbi:hypothetical protein R3W88_000208 [Solanum pinnatisectum]|uniref:Peptidase S8/S53 domain-containing protein n=1 Tax=Solanum pinnatisectum TaxID=50273 RepID=A0AAV9MEP2_9SOLN|nr:hypothetical protein R3W88_000208 [Solanum pinnatisectum]